MDSFIEDIFVAKQRKIIPLETERDRSDADDEEIYERGAKGYPLHIILYLLESNFNHLIRSFEVDPPVIHIPSLDEVNLAEPMVLNYLKGENDFSTTPLAVSERNKKWWERSIAPLLEEKVKRITSVQKRSVPLPSDLFCYGAAHNRGTYSILKKIQEVPDLSLHLWTRKGFVPLLQTF